MTKSLAEKPGEYATSPAFSTTNLLMGALVRALELGAEQEGRAEKAEHDLKHMEDIAMLDHLTGLRNRRALQRTYSDLQSGGRRRPTLYQVPHPHSLLVLDVDNFKIINDTQGHDTGDNILKRVADIMHARVRETDVAARWGGDEFAILFRYTSPSEASRVGEDIREQVETGSNNGEPAVTISVGVAPIDLSLPLKSNVHMADLALYEAKRMGRNCVAQYDPSMSEEV